MKKQKLLMSTDSIRFHESVTELMEQGWKAVPGTLVITACARTYAPMHFALVLEEPGNVDGTSEDFTMTKVDSN